ncbi:MAG: putative bifunctional diguanylate cyclase/phosphodiesterase [Aestuariibacter sp.]
MQLLVVEASAIHRAVISRALRHGHLTPTFYFADSIEKAEDILLRQDIDVVLLTDTLPFCDAIEMLIELRIRAMEKEVTTLIVTEKDDDLYTLRCVRAGAHDVILLDEVSPRRLRRALTQATARSELELKLRQSYDHTKYLAEHDPLTGLYNRYMFDMYLKNSVEEASVCGSVVALILINIDRFQYINDTFGHDVGDTILASLARRLETLCGANETLFRLGGDEFAVLVKQQHKAHLSELQSQLEQSLSEPFEAADLEIKLSASMGVAFYPQNCQIPDMLLRCADIAMFHAKDIGGNSLCFVDEKLQRQFQRRFSVEHELRKALQHNEFVLHFQPVVAANNRCLISCEALVRWEHPKHGLVFPDYFIDIAEESGLIVEIGRWIIDCACQQLSAWQDKVPRNFVMALNISPQQLYDKSLVEYLRDRMAHYQIEPRQIEIEITETVLLKHTQDVMANLHGLVGLGVGLALDDFGTGYSSIQHLHHFPISTVKIDRSLMPQNQQAEKSLALLRGLVSMIDSLSMSIVAEGIESDRNANLCRELGVGRLQGYYFSKPISSEQFDSHFLQPKTKKLAVHS